MCKENIKAGTEKDRIRELRESMGLRKTEFGAKIGYTHQQVTRIEEGLTPVSDEARRQICREYRVSEEWLKNGQGGSKYPVEETGAERSKRLRQAYEESGLTMREFSRVTHTSLTMLNDVIAGRHQMTVKYAKRLEETLGIGADWILYGDEAAKEYPCDDRMVRYIKKHPEIRKQLWDAIKEEESTAVDK